MRQGPIEVVIQSMDARLSDPSRLTEAELADIVVFLRDGLLDERARPENLMRLIPQELPSGLPPLTFERESP